MSGKVTFQAHNPDYDTLHPVEEIDRFCVFLRAVKERYDGNTRRLAELDTEETDINHAIELAQGLTKPQKNRLFRKLRENLNERRACKSENELLESIYTRTDGLLEWLPRVLGTTRSAKKTIEGRMFTGKTGILDSVFEEEPDQT